MNILTKFRESLEVLMDMGVIVTLSDGLRIATRDGLYHQEDLEGISVNMNDYSSKQTQTMNIPLAYNEMISELYDNRSKFIRRCLKAFLLKEYKVILHYKDKIEERMMENRNKRIIKKEGIEQHKRLVNNIGMIKLDMRTLRTKIKWRDE